VTDGVRYVLELTAEPGDVPPIVRVRQLLKYAKRTQGLRCVAATEVKPAADSTGTGPGQGGAAREA
jgi:hypothetical protein